MGKRFRKRCNYINSKMLSLMFHVNSQARIYDPLHSSRIVMGSKSITTSLDK